MNALAIHANMAALVMITSMATSVYVRKDILELLVRAT
jgi:hypothetical protein